MDTIISNSVEDTMRLGRIWGEQAQSGWIIGLRGDLGAGKTHLVKGVARGLGITDKVHSPTYNLLNEYGGGRFPLFHLDLYRLETRIAIVEAGLEDYLTQPQGVAVVEWAERWFDYWPRSASAVRSSLTENLRLVDMDVVQGNDDARRIRYEDFGD